MVYVFSTLMSTVMHNSADSVTMTQTLVSTLVPFTSVNTDHMSMQVSTTSMQVSTTSMPNMYNAESTMSASVTIHAPLLTTTPPTATTMSPSPPLSSTFMLWHCVLIAVGTVFLVSLVLLVILLVCRRARAKLKLEAKLKSGLACVVKNQLEENQIDVLANPCSGSYISADDHQYTDTSTPPHNRTNISPSAELDNDTLIFENKCFGTNGDFLPPMIERSHENTCDLCVKISGAKSTVQHIECSEHKHSQPEFTSQNGNVSTSDLHPQESLSPTNIVLMFEDGTPLQDYPVSEDPETYSTADDEGSKPTIYSSQLLVTIQDPGEQDEATEDDDVGEMTCHEEAEVQFRPKRNTAVDITVTAPGPYEGVAPKPGIYGLDMHVSQRSSTTSAIVEGLTSPAKDASGDLPPHFATIQQLVEDATYTYDIPNAERKNTTSPLEPSTLFDDPNYMQDMSLDPGGMNTSTELQGPLPSGTTQNRAIDENKDPTIVHTTTNLTDTSQQPMVRLDLQRSKLSPDISDCPRSDSSSSSLELEISHV